MIDIISDKYYPRKGKDKQLMLQLIDLINQDKYTGKQLRKQLHITSNVFYGLITHLSFMSPLYEIEILKNYSGRICISDYYYFFNRQDFNFDFSKLKTTIQNKTIQKTSK